MVPTNIQAHSMFRNRNKKNKGGVSPSKLPQSRVRVTFVVSEPICITGGTKYKNTKERGDIPGCAVCYCSPAWSRHNGTCLIHHVRPGLWQRKYYGSVYTLTSSVFSSGATTTTYDFLYTVNTTGYTGAGSGLDAVVFKVAAEANIVSSTLLNPTYGFGQPVLGDLAAGSGCSG